MDPNIASIVTARTVFEAGVPTLGTTKLCRRADRACKQRATCLVLIDGKDKDNKRSIHFRDGKVPKQYQAGKEQTLVWKGGNIAIGRPS